MNKKTIITINLNFLNNSLIFNQPVSVSVNILEGGEKRNEN